MKWSEDSTIAAITVGIKSNNSGNSVIIVVDIAIDAVAEICNIYMNESNFGYFFFTK